MISNFATAMKSCSNTWNGAVSLPTPDISGNTRGRLSLFFKGVRGLNHPRLYEYLRKSADENLIDTFLLVFHIRDCRGGKGERDLGRRALVWLFLNYPEEFSLVAHLIPEYGRWDDLMDLWPGVLNLNNIDHVRLNYCSTIKDEQALINLKNTQLTFVNILARQLANDREQMEAGNPITICAKWAPSENDSYDRKYGVVSTLTKVMNITLKKYRKEYTTPLRQYLKIVEKYMCEKRWDEIEYSKVPSCAMKRLKNAFAKHEPEQFASWKDKLRKGETTVKAKQLFPYELIHEIRVRNIADEVCEGQWKVLEDDVIKNGTLEQTLFVCDVSGSMASWGDDPNRNTKKKSFSPMDVAISLSLLGANSVKGLFHNHIITFEDKPTFHLVKETNILQRWRQLTKASWGGSTNLQAIFELILEKSKSNGLSQEDMPKRLFIISDMQFDIADRTMTNFEMIKIKYAAAGYIPPDIVFWNVCGSSEDFPVSVTDNGTSLISGFSPSILSSFMNQKDFSPYSILRDTLDSIRLSPIRGAFNID